MSLNDNNQLVTYKNMLDSMVEMLQLTGIILKQRIESGAFQPPPGTSTARTCEVECIACDSNRGKMCRHCAQGQPVQQVRQAPPKDVCPSPCLQMLQESLARKESQQPRTSVNKPSEESPEATAETSAEATEDTTADVAEVAPADAEEGTLADAAEGSPADAAEDAPADVAEDASAAEDAPADTGEAVPPKL